jgi:hypothetical protein
LFEIEFRKRSSALFWGAPQGVGPESIHACDRKSRTATSAIARIVELPLPRRFAFVRCHLPRFAELPRAASLGTKKAANCGGFTHMSRSLADRASSIHSSASFSQAFLSTGLIAIAACRRHSSASLRNLSTSLSGTGRHDTRELFRRLQSRRQEPFTHV